MGNEHLKCGQGDWRTEFFKLKQHNFSTKHTCILIGLHRITTKNLASELRHFNLKIYQTSETSLKVYVCIMYTHTLCVYTQYLNRFYVEIWVNHILNVLRQNIFSSALFTVLNVVTMQSRICIHIIFGQHWSYQTKSMSAMCWNLRRAIYADTCGNITLYIC